MAHLLKTLARRIFLSDAAQSINQVVVRISQGVELRRWERKLRLIPPPHIVKQTTVLAYAYDYSLDTLVETGTYLGAMIDATKDAFRRIYSIELDRALYRRAKRKYARYSHISLIHGDSSEALAGVLREVQQPCLFWLDAHHSGVLTAKGPLESPILQEIEHILAHPIAGHVILIDDAHAFVGREGYPALSALQRLIATRRPGWEFTVEDDIIRIHATL